MNAKEELLEAIGHNDIVCAWVQRYISYTNRVKIVLRKGYTEEEYHRFLNDLNFEYYDGHGTQELFGTVWLDKGWLERGEYDGSEWWDHKRRPTIPKELR